MSRVFSWARSCQTELSDVEAAKIADHCQSPQRNMVIQRVYDQDAPVVGDRSSAAIPLDSARRDDGCRWRWIPATTDTAVSNKCSVARMRNSLRRTLWRDRKRWRFLSAGKAEKIRRRLHIPRISPTLRSSSDSRYNSGITGVSCRKWSILHILYSYII